MYVMYVCMYCVSVCMHTSIYSFMDICMYSCMHIAITRVCVYAKKYEGVCVCVCVNSYSHMCSYAYMYVRIYVYMYVCV